MELKKAGAVFLIAILAATLVVAIARSLDIDAANGLEPKLDQIVEELRALREQGGGLGGEGGNATASVAEDGLTVFYFYSNTRCPTCRSIESQALETVETTFAAELESGTVSWEMLNYEESSSEELAKTFGCNRHSASYCVDEEVWLTCFVWV